MKYLRCEYKVEPLGVDVRQPRLSWILQSTRRGVMQTAYQILVASSEARLKQDAGDLWDSGKVETDRMNQIAYAGGTLTSGQVCFWKVRVWDGQGRPSPWSQISSWTMGLLGEGGFEAKWVGLDASRDRQGPEPELSLKGAQWIWCDEGNPAQSAPVGTRYFRKMFALDTGRTITRAVAALSVDNSFVCVVNGKQAGRGNNFKTAVPFELTDLLKPGVNIVTVQATNEGDNSNPAGLLGAIKVEFDTGDPVMIVTNGTWICAPKNEDDAWDKVKVLGPLGQGPWGQVDVGTGQEFLPPAQFLRQAFALSKPVKRAVVYASALGNYELYINGHRIGQDYFLPGWTDYSIRNYYNTYDVTDALGTGDNVLGAILADGWYSGFVGFGNKRDHYGENTRFAAQLCVEYADGTRDTIITDDSARAATGPILQGDFLKGETYDARLEIPDWCDAGFDDSAWQAVDVTDKIEASMESHPGVPVQVFQEIRPKTITEPQPGVYVLNMGTNFAGFVRLKVKGEPGKTVVLRFAERLNPDGTIYVTNLRSATSTDTYICKSDATETWQPRFTFHGFQYVEVAGLGYRPDLDTITGVELTSATPVAGSFETNDAQTNTLYHNICQTQRANFIEIPTDCPQRDERLGWTGDAQVYVRTATNNTDVSAFFTKWLVDLEDAQGDNGAFPDVAPRKVAMGDGTAAWGDAGVICPWTIYEVYGDRRVLERHYESMTRWVEYCRETTKGTLLRPASGYGDWLSINADTPKDVLATAYFAYSTYLTGQTALRLDRFEDYQKYNALFADIKTAFNKAYVAEDGRIKGDTQTVYVLALTFDLLNQTQRALAEQYLVEDIQAKGWLLSTGFIGTKDLMMTLYRIGRLDVAYRLFHNDAFPSWGFSIKHGATSIWERWDGWTPEKGFQTPGMNSFAHYSFGAVNEWMFKTIGGIDFMNPGYKKLQIRPQPGGKITWARVHYDSIRGRISSEWSLKEGVFTLKATVPPNTVGLIFVPAPEASAVKEAGGFEGARYLRMEGGAAVYRVEGGTFDFTSTGVRGIEMVE
ncbi:MAG: glycoside hydrolase family 78 protein [Phycisphaerae bacterium]|nr:glycoside hydrolase family 78 protein [Phycisphaerae bacterium]